MDLGIMTLIEKGGELSPRVFHGYSPEFRKETETFRKQKGKLLAALLRDPTVVVVEDVPNDPRVFMKSALEREGVRTYIGVPLRAKDKTVGLLSPSEPGVTAKHGDGLDRRRKRRGSRAQRRNLELGTGGGHRHAVGI